MKELFKIFMILMIVFASGCSRHDDSGIDTSGIATLTLDAVFNDIAASSGEVKRILKSSCSDSSPAYVAVVLSGTTNIGTLDKPMLIPVGPDPKGKNKSTQFANGDATELELEPGSYSLDYFAVYDGDPAEAETSLLWVAPTKEGAFGSSVERPLPLKINLGAGATKALNVHVLCFDRQFDDRYTGFAISPVRVIDVCFFADYCSPAGRHHTADYTLNMWLGDSDQGELLYSNESPETGRNEDGDFYAKPLCLNVAAPVNDMNDSDVYLYYELVLNSWEENYGTVGAATISGQLTSNEVNQYATGEGKLDFINFKFSCDSTSQLVDIDGDGVADSIDNCPEISNGDQEDSDEDGIGNLCDNCPQISNPEQEDLDEDGFGDACVPLENDDTDGDGVPNGEDICPATPANSLVDEMGCPTGS